MKPIKKYLQQIALMILIFFLIVLFISFKSESNYTNDSETHTTTLGINSSPWFTYTRTKEGWDYDINMFSFSGLCLVGAFGLIGLYFKIGNDNDES